MRRRLDGHTYAPRSFQSLYRSQVQACQHLEQRVKVVERQELLGQANEAAHDTDALPMIRRQHDLGRNPAADVVEAIDQRHDRARP